MGFSIACKSRNQNPFPKGGIQQKASQDISLTREISPVPSPEQNLPISAVFCVTEQLQLLMEEVEMTLLQFYGLLTFASFSFSTW